MNATAVRVAHVPADHTYVEHATTSPGPTLAPAVGASSAPALDLSDAAGWLRRHGEDVDVVHAHFGFERCTVDGLEDVLLDLDRRGLPLVWTAHDLTNPHLVDQGVYEAQLALLARHAAGVVTLTDGAAAEIAGRWGRHAAVVPHPHLAPVEELHRSRPAAGRDGVAVVGVPLGLLRPATDRRVVLALLDAFAPGAAREAGTPPDGPLTEGPLAEAAGRPVLLRVLLRQETLSDGFPRPDAELVARLRAAAGTGAVELRVSGRTPEAELWPGLRELAALVLPYRWGSHSGWVEACHDVGTPVVAPRIGHWSEQHPVHGFDSGAGAAGGAAGDTGRDGPDPVGLLRALQDALAAGPRRDDVADERLQERAHVVAAHAGLHARAAAGERW